MGMAGGMPGMGMPGSMGLPAGMGMPGFPGMPSMNLSSMGMMPSAGPVSPTKAEKSESQEPAATSTPLRDQQPTR